MTRTYKAIGTYKLQVASGLLGVTGAVASGTTPAGEGSFNLRTIRCNSATATDQWLMAFASATVPANGTAPIFGALLIPANYISEDTFPDGRVIDAPGIYFVVSSTRDTLTANAAAVVDISVDIDEFELQPVGESVVGDYTTACKQLQVWAEATTPKHLYKVEAANTSGSTVYVQVFAQDAPADGQVPLGVWPVAAGKVLEVAFGNNSGFSPYRQAADGTAYRGCTVFFSSTQNTKTLVAANAGTLRATYKT